MAHHNESWWKKKGYLREPRVMFADGGEIVFRVWGGGSPKLGQYFLQPAPKTRFEAERLCSVFEWGNTCQYLTRFRVRAGAKLFVGRVDPGDAFHPAWHDPRAFQIMISQPTAMVEELETTPLHDDLGRSGVSPRSGSA